MTRYDFTSKPNRLTHHAEKWKKVEADPELLPLWIADMDFEPLPEIRQVIRDYANHQIFGYPYASDSLYQSIIDWEGRQHGYKIERESILLIEGVVPTYRDWETDRKSTRLNSSHRSLSRMPSSA